MEVRAYSPDLGSISGGSGWGRTGRPIKYRHESSPKLLSKRYLMCTLFLKEPTDGQHAVARYMPPERQDFGRRSYTSRATMSQPPPSTYAQGHHAAVTANHVIRTAEADAAFLLPHLKPHYHILDVGCGPGSITAGLAKYVPEGSVTGVDLTPEILKQAHQFLQTLGFEAGQVGNVGFELGNVLEGLHFGDKEFDVVYCNQTLIHIPDPVKAMREMRRVCKEGGIVACREGDPPFHFYPELPGLQVFHKYLWMLIHGPLPMLDPAATSSSFNPEQPCNIPHPPNNRAGSRIHVWARLAGFDPDRIVKDASVQVMATQEKRDFLAEVMIARIEKAGHREKFVQLGATEEDIDTIVRDLRHWKGDKDGWYAVMNCEVICFV
jgi:ubiquinone/menaquinone biosynthesis C-methylase UbiE